MLQARYVIEVRNGQGEIARCKGQVGEAGLFGGTSEPAPEDIERCIDSCEGEGLVAWVEVTYVKVEEGEDDGLPARSEGDSV